MQIAEPIGCNGLACAFLPTGSGSSAPSVCAAEERIIFGSMGASVTSFESGGADLGCRGSSLGRSRHLLVKVAQRGVLTFREFFNFCFGE